MKNNKIKIEKRQYGLVKEIVAEGCEKNMSAKEISDETGISPHTIYSVARNMGMKPRYVYNLKKKFAHGELTKTVINLHHKNMTVNEISQKIGYDADTIKSIIRKTQLKKSKYS